MKSKVEPGDAGGDAAAIIARLGLVPHPKEGGYFRETYRAGEALAEGALAARYGGGRAVATAIYYLLTPATFSAPHRLAGDEIFHFYAGDPVEQPRLYPDGQGEVVVLGADLAAGMRPQAVVPRGVWRGARLRSAGRYALLGCSAARWRRASTMPITRPANAARSPSAIPNSPIGSRR